MSAIHLQPYRHSPGALRRRAALDALSEATEWVFATLRIWGQRQRERAQLATLDDRMLKDIGLNRGEREFLANKPFWKE
jgi:uncharacterized protein YjiS (DUF1127 family)